MNKVRFMSWLVYSEKDKDHRSFKIYYINLYIVFILDKLEIFRLIIRELWTIVND